MQEMEPHEIFASALCMQLCYCYYIHPVVAPFAAYNFYISNLGVHLAILGTERKTVQNPQQPQLLPSF